MRANFIFLLFFLLLSNPKSSQAQTGGCPHSAVWDDINVDGCIGFILPGGSFLYPCQFNVGGIYLLPYGTPLHIDYSLTNCNNTCQAGTDIIVNCARVTGGNDVSACINQGFQMGSSGLPGFSYQWKPTFHLQCDTCAVTAVLPSFYDYIYQRDAYIPNCPTCPPVKEFFNVHLEDCPPVASNEVEVQNVSIEPSPVTDLLRVRNLDFSSYRILDLSGRVRASGARTEDGTIDVSYLKSGIYAIELKFEHGVHFHKFIKL